MGAGNVVNKVENVYDDFGQLVAQYQSHSGAVSRSTTPKVQYAYAAGTQATNQNRPTSMTYPDGRVLNYNYGSAGGMNDILSRIESLIDNDGSTHLVDYTYLGSGTVIRADLAEADVHLDLWGDMSGQFDGVDRFNRIIDNRWYDYGASEDRARIRHAYDRMGRRLYRQNTVAEAANAKLDELYTYDGLNRLTDDKRGTLPADRESITPGTESFHQQWGLDPVGNWSSFDQDDDGDGTWDLEQDRTDNKVNEITDITETTGPAWTTPTYDAAGNTTLFPQAGAPTSSYTATYDAWNRLVKIEDGADTLAEYTYDGQNWRVIATVYTVPAAERSSSSSSSQSSLGPRHFYYTGKWEIAEERIDTSTDPDRQYVWGRRYVDEVLLRDRDTTGNGTLDERLYALQDVNFNVTCITDTGGDAVERYSYSPYGTRTIMTGAFGSRISSSFDWHIGHQGLIHDEQTELIYQRRRIWNIANGRFNQPDPAGYPDGMNRYAGYHIMHGGLDPQGLRVLSYENCSFTRTVDINVGDRALTRALPTFRANVRSMDVQYVTDNWVETPSPRPGEHNVKYSNYRTKVKVTLTTISDKLRSGYKEICEWECDNPDDEPSDIAFVVFRLGRN